MSNTTFEIALQQSKSRPQHSKSHFNIRNRASTVEIAIQHSKSRFDTRGALNFGLNPGEVFSFPVCPVLATPRFPSNHPITLGLVFGLSLFSKSTSPGLSPKFKAPRSTTRNRASTFEIALSRSKSRPQHSKSRFNTRNRASAFRIALQHSESRSNTRNRTSNTKKRVSSTRKHLSSTRKHHSSTRKHLSSTRKPQKYQIL